MYNCFSSSNNLIDNLSDEYSFLSTIDITNMGFAQVKNEIMTLLNMKDMFEDFSGLADGSMSITDIDTETIVEALKSGENSELIGDILTGLGEELSESFDIDINFEEVNFAEEADTIGKFIDMAKDPEQVTVTEVAEALASSELALELAKVTEVTIPVDETTYNDVVDTLTSNSNLTQDQIDTILGLFVTE